MLNKNSFLDFCVLSSPFCSVVDVVGSWLIRGGCRDQKKLTFSSSCFISFDRYIHQRRIKLKQKSNHEVLDSNYSFLGLRRWRRSLCAQCRIRLGSPHHRPQRHRRGRLEGLEGIVRQNPQGSPLDPCRQGRKGRAHPRVDDATGRTTHRGVPRFVQEVPHLPPTE